MITEATRLQSVKEYYFSVKLKEVAKLTLEGKPIINMAIGSPDLPADEKIKKSFFEAFSLPNIYQYQSYRGVQELRESFADFYKKKYDVCLNAATEILPLMGSKEGIMHISMAFLNKADKVLVPNPGYPTYSSVAKLLEAVPITYNLSEKNNWLPNFEELEKQNLSKVKIMWINYPHMPTGIAPSLKQLESIVNFAKAHQILLVNDNPYSFILNQKPLSIFNVKGAEEVALELNSLSKTFNMAGCRVGVLLGKKEKINSILKVKTNIDSGMFLATQKAAVTALNLSNVWLEKLNITYEKRRQKLFSILDVLKCTYNKNQKGLFVWAKLPNGETSEKFSDQLLYDKNIFVTPGNIFGSNGEGYIRVSLCVSEEELKEVLRRISNKK